MAVSYSQLVNKNGTIYNTATGQGYSTPAQLAADLGVSASAINWNNIASNPNWQPQSQSSQQSSSSSSSQQSSSAPATTTNNSTASWNLSSWQMGSNGWATQPVLTIDGQNYTFATPQEYIDKMQGLQGANASTFIGQFQSALPYWQTTTAGKTSSSQTQNQQPSQTTTQTASGLQMPSTVSYQDLVNNNGTIYNTKTGQGYSTPDQLAQAMGIPTSSIQWNQISAGTATSASSASSSSGVPQMFLAADGHTVTDAQGNYISLQQYQQLTGQTGVDSSKLNWDFVNKSPAPNPATNKSTTLPSTGDPNLDNLQNALASTPTGSSQVDPNAQLTPADVQNFLDQATAQVSPYYQSQITSIRDQLNQNLDSMQKQYELGIQADQAKFQQNLASSRETAAGNGLAFSGVRGLQELNAGNAETNTEAQAAQTAADNAQKAITSTEQQIGTRNLANLSFPGMTEYTASTADNGSLNAGRTLPFTTGLSTGGDIVGTQTYDQNRDISNLQNYMEQQAVASRTLNFNPTTA
jgi:hypothetical protein